MSRCGVMTLAVSILALLALPACGPVGGDLTDPASSAPELAGNWTWAWWDGTAQEDAGCYQLDATGDPQSLSGNNMVQDIMGVNTVYFDGVWRSSSFHGIPVEYAGTGQTTKSGNTYTIEMTGTARAFGITFTYTQVLTGTFEGDTLQVQGTEFTTLPPTLMALIGLTADGSEYNGTLVRGACP
jgi:hypothetical protein